MTENGELVLKEAFGLVAEKGWRRFSRAEVAARAGVTLAEVHAILPRRATLVPALGRHLDAAMLAGPVGELETMSVRDRLFELFMRRLDAMAPFKPGLVALRKDAQADPALLAGGLGNLSRTVDWLIEAAGIPQGDWREPIARTLLAGLSIRLSQVWLTDDTEDQARTLAELDKRLGQLERLAQWGWRRGAAESGRDAPGQAAATGEPA